MSMHYNATPDILARKLVTYGCRVCIAEEPLQQTNLCIRRL